MRFARAGTVGRACRGAPAVGFADRVLVSGRFGDEQALAALSARWKAHQPCRRAIPLAHGEVDWGLPFDLRGFHLDDSGAGGASAAQLPAQCISRRWAPAGRRFARQRQAIVCRRHRRAAFLHHPARWTCCASRLEPADGSSTATLLRHKGVLAISQTKGCLVPALTTRPQMKAPRSDIVLIGRSLPGSGAARRLCQCVAG